MLKKWAVGAVVGAAAVTGLVVAAPAASALSFPSGSVTVTQTNKTVNSTTKNHVTTTVTCIKKTVNGVVVQNGCTTVVTTH